MQSQVLQHTISDFFKLRIPYIELNPPYQREEVWDNARQKQLITSIIEGIPIGSIILNDQGIDDEDKEYIVIDGKQRVSTLINFYKQGKFKDGSSFKIDVFFPSLKKNIKCSYKQLCEWARGKTEKASDALSIVTKIKGFKLTCLECTNLNLIEQGELFEKVNFSLPLSVEETLFGKFYNVKNIIGYVESKLNKALELSSTKKDKRNLRGKVNGEVLKLFSCLFSDNSLTFNPTFKRVQNCEKKSLNKFCEHIHQQVIVYLDKHKDKTNFYSSSFEEKYEEVESFLQESLGKSNFKLLKSYLVFVNSLVDKEVIVPIIEAKKQSTSWWLIVYFSMFLLEKHHADIVTNAMLANHRDLVNLRNLFKDYKLWLLEGYDENHHNFYNKVRQMTNKDTFEKHSKKLEELFNKHISDTDPKYPTISEEDRRLAKEFFKENGSICPCCKRQLKDNEIHIDHFKPASLNSLTPLIATCFTCNQKKSNNDQETIQQINNYMNGDIVSKFEKWKSERYRQAS